MPPVIGLDDQFRFWLKVDRDGPDDCWNWIPSHKRINPDFRINKHTYLAARVAYYLQTGNMLVCHTCDNFNCMNINHLYLGTASDNAQDAVASGISHWKQRKLTGEEANKLRQMYNTGKYTMKQLARIFNISLTATWTTIHGKYY